MNTKRSWFSLKSAIAVATGLAAIYLICLQTALPMILVLVLFLSAIIALVYMVIRILKDPYSTDKTFDEYFYQDREDIRRCGKE